jgi:hypothetical protein
MLLFYLEKYDVTTQVTPTMASLKQDAKLFMSSVCIRHPHSRDTPGSRTQVEQLHKATWHQS